MPSDLGSPGLPDEDESVTVINRSPSGLGVLCEQAMQSGDTLERLASRLLTTDCVSRNVSGAAEVR